METSFRPVGTDDIVLIRHAETDVAQLARFAPVYHGARFDFLPLSSRGLAQAELLADQLRRCAHEVSRICSSPYTRSLQTAACLSRRLDAELAVDLRLHDWLPTRDGALPLTAAIVAKKAEEFGRYSASETAPPPQRTWETAAEMRARVVSVVRDSAASLPLVLVTHEAVIRAVLGPMEVHPASMHVVSRLRLLPLDT